MGTHACALLSHCQLWHFGHTRACLLEQSSPTKDVEILLEGAAVEGHGLHEVLDEVEFRGEGGQRNDAEVLVLTMAKNQTHRKASCHLPINQLLPSLTKEDASRNH